MLWEYVVVRGGNKKFGYAKFANGYSPQKMAKIWLFQLSCDLQIGSKNMFKVKCLPNAREYLLTNAKKYTKLRPKLYYW